jgi:hypothetical protein
MRRVSQSTCHNVITYCFSCVDAFRSVGCKSFHALDYIFAPNGTYDEEKFDFNFLQKSSRTWKNRWVMARRISVLKETR